MTARRRLARAAPAALLAALAVLYTAAPVAAQGVPDPPQPGGIGDLLADPGKWLTTLFNALLVNLGKDTANHAIAFMNSLLHNGTLINQTPPALSYDNKVVQDLSEKLRLAADIGLAAVAALGGFNMMINPHIRAPYHGALELVPRVLCGGVLVNTSLSWSRFVIDTNNGLCSRLGPAAIPGLDAVSQPTGGAVLMNLIAIFIYLVMGMLLFVQMLMRLALVDVLVIIAPIALLCWVLPQTYGWARLWFNAFFAAVFVQFVQVAVLQLGTNLIAQLPSALPGIGADPVNNGSLWLTSLLLGVAVLQLARQVPRFMPWYPVLSFATNRRDNNSRQSSGSSSGSNSSGETSRTRSRGR